MLRIPRRIPQFHRLLSVRQGADSRLSPGCIQFPVTGHHDLRASNFPRRRTRPLYTDCKTAEQRVLLGLNDRPRCCRLLRTAAGYTRVCLLKLKRSTFTAHPRAAPPPELGFSRTDQPNGSISFFGPEKHHQPRLRSCSLVLRVGRIVILMPDLMRAL